MRRTPAERRLVLRALWLLIAVRIGMRATPVQILRARLRRWPLGAAAAGPERIAWAVRTAARYLPGSACLAQALAVEALMERCGHASNLRIGVARTEAGKFEAHAWVESGGTVVIGGGELDRYTPLPPLEPRS
jgi:hypothetical protein